MTEIYIGLGSNIDDPVYHVESAFDDLIDLPSTRLVKRSGLFRTDPVGPRNQPDYVNAVAELRTCLPPLVLLRHLLAIEHRHHRVRRRRWGQRTLDLDILLYANRVIDHPRLLVPHPRLHLRGFALIPLNEINPGLLIPRKGKLETLVSRLHDAASVRRII